MNINSAGKVAGSILAISALCGGLVSFLDARHALAGDLKALEGTVRLQQIETYRREIEQLNAQIAPLKAKQIRGEITVEEAERLVALELAKESYEQAQERAAQ